MSLESRRLLRADLDLMTANARIRELESEVFAAERRGRDAAKSEMEAMWQPTLRAAEERGEARGAEKERLLLGEATVTTADDIIVVHITPGTDVVAVDRALLVDLITQANPGKVVREV